MDAMLGLVVAAIGLLTFVVALNASDSGKKLISFVIAGIITLAGAYYYVSSEIRGYQMRRRINEIQQRQSVNLEEIQKRLRDSQPQAPVQPAKK